MRGIAGVTVPMLEDARPAVRVPARLAFAALLAAAGLAAGAALEPVLSRPYYFPVFSAFIVPAVLAGKATCTRGVAQVETERSFVNGLVGAITWSIYTPLHAKVTCASGPVAR